MSYLLQNIRRTRFFFPPQISIEGNRIYNIILYHVYTQSIWADQNGSHFEIAPRCNRTYIILYHYQTNGIARAKDASRVYTHMQVL